MGKVFCASESLAIGCERCLWVGQRSPRNTKAVLRGATFIGCSQAVLMPPAIMLDTERERVAPQHNLMTARLMYSVDGHHAD